MLRTTHVSYEGKKPIVITAEAFKILCRTCHIDKLFNKYFVYFLSDDWELLTGDRVPISESGYSTMLYKYWWNWTVKEFTSLRQLSSKIEELSFCGASLRDLYYANQSISDDMIFTPEELVNQL